ncbi:Protein of unknown function [Bacillus mycoides]|nr:Protein of unknown function [Bacillus mycoides]
MFLYLLSLQKKTLVRFSVST